MANYNLMGVLISKRRAHAPAVQEILTRYGCLIRVRLGLHDLGDACSDDGLLVLQLTDSKDEVDELHAELNALDGVSAEIITLNSIE